jgi:hypothetical protein
MGTMREKLPVVRLDASVMKKQSLPVVRLDPPQPAKSAYTSDAHIELLQKHITYVEQQLERRLRAVEQVLVQANIAVIRT